MPASRLTAAQRATRDEYVRNQRSRGYSVEHIALDNGISTGRVYEILRGATGNRSQRRSTRRQGLNRRFGVEIEFFGVTRSRIESWLSTDLALNGWRVKSDPSVSGAGLELVSPPLQGEAGLAQLRHACSKLNEMGARVNSTCGLHVHHDMRGMTTPQIQNFVASYVQNQQLLDWLVSPSRRSTSHCTYARPWGGTELREYRAGRDAGRGMFSRYRTINPASYHRHGTIEVRQHQGTTNYSKIERWIMLGQAMIDAVVSAGQAIPQAGTLRGLLSSLQCDDDTSAFLIGRAMQFNAPMELV